MKPLTLDKVASVTLNCGVGREVRIDDRFRCREGDVVAVRLLSRKTRYNQLELVTGRFSELKPGDIVAGALGHRDALYGYAGHLPTSLAVGDTVHLLNLGGVIGICDSFSPEVGPPMECEVLGQVLHFPDVGERRAHPANVAEHAQALRGALTVGGVPVIIVAGTSMNSGKTYACASLIQELARRKIAVAAAKATGVSLRRDVLAMEDAGARWTTIFTDFGTVTTTAGTAPALARSMLSALAEKGPDVIVLELGDGLMGTYGVDAILGDEELQTSFAAIILAAHDPVGAWGGVRRLREEYGLDVTLVTGPATDTSAGTRRIEELVGVTARNARREPEALTEAVLDAVARRTR
ncbi:MAG: hypothetical protein R3F20_12145 [Planctomycetota bacterium]